MMTAGELRPHSGTERGQVSKPGRLSLLEQRRREHRFEQLWLAGRSLSDAANEAGLTPAAALRFLDRVGVRLMPHVQSEVA
jgi:hypothetical protein